MHKCRHLFSRYVISYAIRISPSSLILKRKMRFDDAYTDVFAGDEIASEIRIVASEKLNLSTLRKKWKDIRLNNYTFDTYLYF